MSSVEYSEPRDWVPADRRWLGLDRRTILPALVVLTIAVIMHSVLPAIDSFVETTRTIPAGQTIALSGGVQLSAPAGWILSEGLLSGDSADGVYPHSAQVYTGPTSISLRSDSFTGTSAELLEQIQSVKGENAFGLRSEVTSITTASGINGVFRQFSDPVADGAIAAFTIDGVGIEVVIRTPADTPSSTANVIGTLLDSITVSEDNK